MIYLDNAATTRMYDEVIDIEKEFERNYFANPSALHSFGMEVEEKVKESRKFIADYIGSDENEIFFTKGATESNNIIINSFKSSENTAITSKLEHASVIDTFNNTQFKEVKLVDNDNFGFIDIKNLENLVDDKTNLISLIYVQNEIGTIQNVKKINEVIRNKNKNVFIHLDATQALGKIDCNVKNLGVDALSFSSHKIHGPKGIGGLYINKKKLGKIKTYLFGGRQELVSSGTLNAPAIYAFYKALSLSKEKEDIDYVKKLNLYLRNKVMDNIENIHVNSSIENSSPYILNISFEKIKSEILLHMLEEDKIYISSGSACSKGKDNRILDAIGLDDKYKDGSIRFSFSSDISFEDLDKVVRSLKKHVEEIRMVF
ncbi:cysteine desulfurase [Anaerococcus sp. AGMB00486]|uniref:Cysteine desulfurase n=2 Tax=Anaerococcus TaxID=165779 RepID=A0ABX2N7G7_9FIRM|nr:MULTISPECIES: cysteine desulfurase family protein [Anaerococcus]MDY3005463.1 cysteine desulfurase family protein [Anaerococcus porci]MSS76891.1 cysteine desulfurase [Anaerococcus porci]NVF10625.1 cysteine desulfurase [Anaerococcus faecalis]